MQFVAYLCITHIVTVKLTRIRLRVVGWMLRVFGEGLGVETTKLLLFEARKIENKGERENKPTKVQQLSVTPQNLTKRCSRQWRTRSDVLAGAPPRTLPPLPATHGGQTVAAWSALRRRLDRRKVSARRRRRARDLPADLGLSLPLLPKRRRYVGGWEGGGEGIGDVCNPYSGVVAVR